MSICITSSSHTAITVGVTEASFEQSESGGAAEVCLNITNGRLEIGVSSSVYTQSVTATGIYFVLVHSSTIMPIEVLNIHFQYYLLLSGSLRIICSSIATGSSSIFSDYQSISSFVPFSSGLSVGDESCTSVTIFEDTRVEDDEVFLIVFGNRAHVTVSSEANSARIVILDNDGEYIRYFNTIT